MDKRLEKAKKEIQKQNAILLSINLLLILSVLNLRHLTNGYKNDNFADFMKGFYLGFVIIVGIIVMSYLVRNIKYAKNEKALIRIYNEIHDERKAKIAGMATKRAMLISIYTMLAMSVIFSYINLYMFIGALITTLLLSLITFACLFYYKRNYTDDI